MTDPFPHEDFDDWAESYDTSVSNDRFPFTGYQDVMTQMVTLAQVRPGMSVLDLGTGTGNLAAEWKRSLDRIVSADVFHHFDLDEKVRILRGLLPRPASGGSMVIGDIAFRDQAALDQVKAEAGEGWEDEFYWLADRSMLPLKKAGLQAGYQQVSSCAGIFVLSIPR